MTDKTYNGWTNKPTWLFNVWAGDDEALTEWARECMEEAECDRDDAARMLADRLESYFDEMADESHAGIASGASLFSDLFQWAAAHIEWREIADHLVADVECWTAGSNAPGYMPDETPAAFLSFDDAVEYVAYMMDADADNYEDGIVCVDIPAGSDTARENATALREAAESARRETGDFSYSVAGRVYFVARV